MDGSQTNGFKDNGPVITDFESIQSATHNRLEVRNILARYRECSNNTIPNSNPVQNFESSVNQYESEHPYSKILSNAKQELAMNSINQTNEICKVGGSLNLHSKTLASVLDDIIMEEFLSEYLSPHKTKSQTQIMQQSLKFPTEPEKVKTLIKSKQLSDHILPKSSECTSINNKPFEVNDMISKSTVENEVTNNNIVATFSKDIDRCVNKPAEAISSENSLNTINKIKNKKPQSAGNRTNHVNFKQKISENACQFQAETNKTNNFNTTEYTSSNAKSNQNNLCSKHFHQNDNPTFTTFQKSQNKMSLHKTNFSDVDINSFQMEHLALQHKPPILRNDKMKALQCISKPYGVIPNSLSQIEKDNQLEILKIKPVSSHAQGDSLINALTDPLDLLQNTPSKISQVNNLDFNYSRQNKHPKCTAMDKKYVPKSQPNFGNSQYNSNTDEYPANSKQFCDIPELKIRTIPNQIPYKENSDNMVIDIDDVFENQNRIDKNSVNESWQVIGKVAEEPAHSNVPPPLTERCNSFHSCISGASPSVLNYFTPEGFAEPLNWYFSQRRLYNPQTTFDQWDNMNNEDNKVNLSPHLPISFISSDDQTVGHSGVLENKIHNNKLISPNKRAISNMSSYSHYWWPACIYLNKSTTTHSRKKFTKNLSAQCGPCDSRLSFDSVNLTSRKSKGKHLTRSDKPYYCSVELSACKSPSSLASSSVYLDDIKEEEDDDVESLLSNSDLDIITNSSVNVSGDCLIDKHRSLPATLVCNRNSKLTTEQYCSRMVNSTLPMAAKLLESGEKQGFSRKRIPKVHRSPNNRKNTENEVDSSEPRNLTKIKSTHSLFCFKRKKSTSPSSY